MRCFIFGTLGVLLGLGLLFVGRTQYNDYIARVETDRWIDELQPLMREVATNAVNLHSLVGAGENVHKPKLDKNTTIFDVLDSGAIIVKGGREGQLLLLIPSLKDDQITWHCAVGSDNERTGRCKDYGWDNQ